MADNKVESVKKAGKPKTKKKSTNAKKTGKKPANSKAVKSPTAKKPVQEKRVSKSKDIPNGLRESSKQGSSNLDNSIVQNKSKVKRKRKKGKANGERIFWIVIALIVVSVATVGIIFIFQDYSNDRSTPAQLNTPKISDGDIEFVKGLGAEHDLIEEVKVTDQGPIIYVIYTTPAGTPREDVKAVVNEAYKKALEEKPELFETYSFQITVVASGDEAEGVNDYPVIGAMNVGTPGISWMANDGNFIDPTAVEEE